MNDLKLKTILVRMARQKIKRLPKENTILRILSILMMTFMMLSQPAWSGVTKEELMKEEGFSKATPEDRLKWLNSQIQSIFWRGFAKPFLFHEFFFCYSRPCRLA